MHAWHLRNRRLLIGRRPLVMGIVNVTPDSFSDAGRFLEKEAALRQAQALVTEGADLVDIGGESTRPGAEPVALDEELKRVVPVVEALAGRMEVPISVDTAKGEVARQCLQAGAEIVNDVTALTGDPTMMEVVRSFEAGVVLMHRQGTPQTMQCAPTYQDVMREIRDFFQERMVAATGSGIMAGQIVLDPGIGFGKTGQHNLEILARLEELQSLGRPICLGVSRKAFLGQILERPVAERLAGSLAAVLFAQGLEAVQIVRVHDVRETRDAVSLFAILQEKKRSGNYSPRGQD